MLQIASHLSSEEDSESEESGEESEDADGEGSDGDDDEIVNAFKNAAETTPTEPVRALENSSAALPKKNLPACSKPAEIGSKAVDNADDFIKHYLKMCAVCTCSAVDCLCVEYITNSDSYIKFCMSVNGGRWQK